MLTAECQLERFLLENPPNEKNIDKAAVELPGVQQELIRIFAAQPKVCVRRLLTTSQACRQLCKLVVFVSYWF